MNSTALNYVEEKIVSIELDSVRLQAEIVLPLACQGMVVFVHSSGVGSYSTRNRYLAHLLRKTAGVATVQIDLLTPQEEAIDLRSKHCSSNVQFLVKRLTAATNWLLDYPLTSHLKIGYFGEQTGADAALLAAAENKSAVGAVVSCSGKNCLTQDALSRLQTPSLLIVGENDLPAITTNQDAVEQIQITDKELKIIPNVGRQFKETGAIEEIARLASHWFKQYLSSVSYPQSGANVYKSLYRDRANTQINQQITTIK
ncbi:dienelactone hydrolase [Calothrix parasitica NIES-267]|uniref:Dienelactone hydrolase n=1 Tax=Calothrix parasitica NIES-267 TaxID=1973488 RepID=A0A1Z4LLB4_9CYAN|nr:dienelactone hydrolase [Calothrix parasitica NIES-267]